LVSYASDGTWCSVTNNKADIDQVLTENLSLVTTALNTISNRAFNGSTNVSAGIDKGVIVLTDTARIRPFAAKTMVLMTDGLWNQGRDPELAAIDAKAKSIVIHTITFGDSADQTSMQRVAAATGGKHFHAPTPEALQNIYREIALSLPVILTE
jgi:Mg-chelatase subunit ChlD